MKTILNERVKHRLIGLLVVLSLMIIFLPPMLRQSNHRLDEVVSFQLPKKPNLPQVAKVAKEPMFKTVKIAKIDIPRSGKIRNTIAEAKVLSTPPESENHVQTAKIEIHKQQLAESKTMRSNEVFTIQLATFSQEINAKALVKTLRAKGFEASSQIVTHPQGAFYQVIVGQLKHRDQAIDLQKKLVNNTQLNGLIIKTKVS